ncbi:MAG: hypothetical protein J6X60_13615, partial [Ruminiclostridium sp.]|nr:hypothetical protein [Ruminiclostridium sp.]
MENADNTIELHTDLAPAKFALPTKNITKLSIIGDGAHDYDKRNITLPKVTSLAPAYELFLKKVSFYSEGATSFAINAKGDLDFENVDFFPTANISVAANHSITLAGVYCTGIGKVSGTNTSSLYVQDDVFVNEAANFKKVSITNGKTFRVFGKVSGIDSLVKGTLRLSTQGAEVASVIKTVDNAEIVLEYSESQNAVLSKLTITDVTTKLNVKVLSYPLYTLSSLPSGTPILTAGGKTDFTAKVTVTNKDGTNSLKAYQYGKEIRAEWPDALTMNGTNYPSFEKAFEAVADGGDYTITLMQNVAPEKFALPTKKLNSLTIQGDGAIRTLTLPKVTSLAPAYELKLENLAIESTGAASLAINGKNDITLIVVHFTPVTNVSVAANATLFLNAGVTGLGKVSGTPTSELLVSDSVTVNEIATFGYVTTTSYTAVIKVSGKVSGVNTLEGKLRMLSADKANTAVIKKVGSGSSISLAYSDGTVTKATVTETTGGFTVTLYNEGTDTLSVLPSGTPILTAGSTTDFTDNITIMNNGNSLRAYYYNKEIRAELPGAVTLNVTQNYPNLEKAFENLVENGDNTIVIHTDLAPAKFALPTKKLHSLRISGDGVHDYDKRKITLPKVTALAPTYDLYLNKISIYSEGATSFAINAKKSLDLENVDFFPDVTITVPANQDLYLSGEYNTGIGKISGTNTSALEVDDNIFVDEIGTFGRVNIGSTKTLTVYGKVASVDKLGQGTLRLRSFGDPITAVIKTVEDAALILDYSVSKEAILTKATVTDVTTALTVSVYDQFYGTPVSLPSGTPILTAGGNVDYTAKVTVTNKDGTNSLKAYQYGKEIRAEYPMALDLNGKSYPSFEKAFEAVADGGDYTITLMQNVAPEKF